GGGKEERSTDL
ncbi:Hypothetical protein NocV09_10100070, partial [Nannochloropsis oceanica]